MDPILLPVIHSMRAQGWAVWLWTKQLRGARKAPQRKAPAQSARYVLNVISSITRILLENKIKWHTPVFLRL